MRHEVRMIDMDTRGSHADMREEVCMSQRSARRGADGAWGAGYGHAPMPTHTLMSQLKHVHSAAQVAIPHETRGIP